MVSGTTETVAARLYSRRSERRRCRKSSTKQIAALVSIGEDSHIVSGRSSLWRQPRRVGHRSLRKTVVSVPLCKCLRRKTALRLRPAPDAVTQRTRTLWTSTCLSQDSSATPLPETVSGSVLVEGLTQKVRIVCAGNGARPMAVSRAPSAICHLSSAQEPRPRRLRASILRLATSPTCLRRPIPLG